MHADPLSHHSLRLSSFLVLGLIGLALLIRLLALALAWGTTPYGDPYNYIHLAQNLLAGEGLALPRLSGGHPLPTAMYPPTLPILLAGLGLVAPLNAFSLWVFNTLVDCVAALLLARLAGLLGAPRAAVPAALAYVLWPSLALMSPLVYKEGLIVALLLGTIVALLEQAKRPGLSWAILSGACAGLLLLTQPGLLTLLPIVFCVFARRFDSWRRWWIVSLAAASATLVVLMPWWVRNALLFGQFVPLTTSGGLALWVGAQTGGGVIWQAPPKSWWTMAELDAARTAAAEGWRIIVADPIGYLVRCLIKFPRSFFYSNWAIDQLILAKGQRWPWLIGSNFLRYGPTLLELWAVVIAAIGLVRLRGHQTTRLLMACIAQVMLFGIWFEFSERHRLFMTPFLLLVAFHLLSQSPRRGAAQ